MIPKLLMITASAIGLLASAEVFARPHFGGDKTIDLAAVEQKVAERQAKVDTNSDGSISEAEFLAAEGGPMVRPGRHPGGFRGHQGHPPGAMGRMGHHGSGPDFDIDFEAVEDDIFNQLDVDDNASLSRQEFSRKNIEAVRRTVFRTRLFKHMDTNGDGALTTSEMPNPLEHLRKMDSNGDGKVTSEERRAARSAALQGDPSPAGSAKPAVRPAG